MKGDILIINENHKKAAQLVTEKLIPFINKSAGKYVITVAGESGAGKSEIAASVAQHLIKNNISSYIFQQDDYFILPPRTNALKREKDITWVGAKEVRLDLLDEQLKEIRKGKKTIEKPLVIFGEDRISTETVDLADIRVIIVEGTYTTMLHYVDTKVFIDRDFKETRESRLERNREKQDDFLEKILTIEHHIIAPQKKLANLIITKDYKLIME